MIIKVLIGVAIALVISWLILIIGLFIIKPKGSVLKEAARILPDVLRLLGRIAKDKTVPLLIRAALFVLFVYIAIPFDPIPDFLPVIGYFDEAILVVVMLRWVAKKAGVAKLKEHWPGSADGIKALLSLMRVNE